LIKIKNEMIINNKSKPSHGGAPTQSISGLCRLETSTSKLLGR